MMKRYFLWSFELLKQLAAAATEVAAAESEQQALSGNDGLPGNLPTQLLQPKASTASTPQPDNNNLSQEVTDKKDEQIELSLKSTLKQEREKLQVQVDSLKERVSQRREEGTSMASNREKRMSRKTIAVDRVAESQAGLERHRFCLLLDPSQAFGKFETLFEGKYWGCYQRVKLTLLDYWASLKRVR